MAATNPQPSIAPSCTFYDVLRILPSTARQVLFCALKRNGSLERARLASTVLRDLLDGQVTTLDINLQGLSLDELLPLLHKGRWLQRWPYCSSVHLVADVTSAADLTLPFATAPPEALQRITRLKITYEDVRLAIPCNTLLGLARSLSQLTRLELHTPGPLPDDDSEAGRRAQALTSYALSQLPKLTSLTVRGRDHLPAVFDSGLLTQLTRLEITGGYGIPAPIAEDFATALVKMTVLRDLGVTANLDHPEPSELLGYLDAVPSSLQSLTLNGWNQHFKRLSFAFDAGLLHTAAIETVEAPLYRDVSRLLAEGLLPSRVLGPGRRLGLLRFKFVDLRGYTKVPDPAGELYARCGQVDVERLICDAASRSAALALMERTGLPQQLKWRPYVRTQTYLLRGRLGAAAAGAGLSTGAASAAGPIPALPLPALLAHVADRMAAAPPAPYTASVVLRGPFVRSLLADFEALRLWLQQLCAEASASAPDSGGLRNRIESRPVPSAEAVVLTRNRWAPAWEFDAITRVAERRSEALNSGDGGSWGGGSGLVMLLEARRSGLSWEEAVDEALQALWDGEAQSQAALTAAPPPAGSGGGGAGDGSSSNGGPVAGNSTVGVALESARWLLDMLEALDGAPESQTLGLPQPKPAARTS